MSAQTSPFVERQFLDWAFQAADGKHTYGTLSEEKIREAYALAYFLYGQENYLDASHFFRLLAVARPSEVKHWKGLGACLQMLKDYEGALNCYASAQLLNGKKKDPYLYLHAADCHHALQEVNKALEALEAARLRAETLKDKRVCKHVKFMREIWSK